MRNDWFLVEVAKGKQGMRRGLKGGLPRFDSFTKNIQKATYYAVGAQQKTGKTAFVDHHFVLSPYLLEPDAKVNWIYYSFEISRLEKMAKFAAYFMAREHNIICDSNYILSRGDKKLSDEHLELVEKIYDTHLKTLFGEYDAAGKQIKKGRIDFIEDKTNPTGIYSHLTNYAKDHGTFITEQIQYKGMDKPSQRIIGYQENDPELITIIVIDHVGLAKRERGFTKKDNIDKISEYMVFFRNICQFTPVLVTQFNRDLGKIDRLKFSGELLQPTLDDFKDTGNLGEDCSMAIALFNPTMYPHIERHLKYNILQIGKGYRSVHILASRNTEAGVNLGLYLDGENGFFSELPLPDNLPELERVYNYNRTRNLLMVK